MDYDAIEACRQAHEFFEKYNKLENNEQENNLNIRSLISGLLLESIEKIGTDPNLGYDGNEDILEKNYEFFDNEIHEDDFDFKVVRGTSQQICVRILEENYSKGFLDKETLLKIIENDLILYFIKNVIITNNSLEDFIVEARSLCLDLLVTNDPVSVSYLFSDFIKSLSMQSYLNEYIAEVSMADEQNKDLIIKRLKVNSIEDVNDFIEEIMLISTIEPLNKLSKKFPILKEIKDHHDEDFFICIKNHIINPDKENSIKKTIKSLEKVEIKYQKKFNLNMKRTHTLDGLISKIVLLIALLEITQRPFELKFYLTTMKIFLVVKNKFL